MKLTTSNRSDSKGCSNLLLALAHSRCPIVWVSLLAGSILPACKDPSTVSEQPPLVGGDPLSEIRQGQYPQLQRPSSVLLRACAAEQREFCRNLPWTREQFNSIAVGVDERGEVCRFLFVPVGDTATLRNQQAEDGTRWTTVYAGGALATLRPDTNGPHAWVEVTYRDSLGVTYGNGTQNAPRAFVSRNEVTCVIPPANAAPVVPERVEATDQLAPAAPTGTLKHPSSESSTQTPSGSEPKTPPSPPTKRCTVQAPLHLRIIGFGSTINCKPAYGADIKVKSGDSVTIKTVPEAGKPVRYYEVNRKCTIADDLIQHKTCVN